MKVSTSTLQNAFGKHLKLAMEGTTIYIEKNNKPVAVLKALEEEDRFYVREEAEAYNTTRSYTYKEFLDIADDENNVRQYEFIHGQIYMLASPAFAHQVAVDELFVQFYSWFKGKPCRPLTSPFDVRLYGGEEEVDDNINVVQPDIIIICDEDKIDEKGKYLGKPRLVLEVLSPSTKSKDIMVKAELYMASDINEYWIVDTEAKHVMIYHFSDGKLLEHKIIQPGRKVCSHIFKGLEVDLEDVFL